MLDNWNSGIASITPSFGDPKWLPGDFLRQTEDPDAAEKPRKLKVIIIDDESLIAETVVEILKHEGFVAMSAPSGFEAIEMAKTWQPDVVLSDVIMPGLNGIEAAIQIREAVPRCRIILFSGQAATVDLLEKARQDGHHFEILAKPIKPEQLVSIIRTASGFVS